MKTDGLALGRRDLFRSSAIMAAAAFSVPHSFATLAAAAETAGATDLQGGVSMVYLHPYSAKLRAGRLQDFVSLLNSLTPVVAKHGWRFCALRQRPSQFEHGGRSLELPNEIAILLRYLIRKLRIPLRALADNRRPDPNLRNDSRFQVRRGEFGFPKRPFVLDGSREAARTEPATSEGETFHQHYK